MKSQIFIILLLWSYGVYGQQPFTCKGQYYLSLTKGGSNSSGLYEVKISTDGQQVYLDTISSSIGLVLNAMGYRITDNFIYGMDPNSARLRKIGSDGLALDLGLPKDIPPAPLYYAGDVTPDGRYLLLIGLGGTTAQIIKVDLEDPLFQCTFVPMQDNTVGIVDIAFDPFTGIMYGHDLRNKRIVIVNPETGAVNTNFLRQPQVDQLGALFFDSFGNLYGYGTYGNFDQDKFVSINKTTGEISLLAQGPLSSGQDGCACPYTLEMQKVVEPEVAYPCTEVIYSFIVSNGSGTTRSGIHLHDTMPTDLIAKKIIYNPFGGIVELNGHLISIENMTIPAGIDTIKVLVEIGENGLGLYRNQAILSGLPPALGSFAFSDNPATFIEKDSTDLLVKPLDISFLTDYYKTCPGDSVYVDASLHGLTYLWSDGDTRASKWLPSPGSYILNASSLCDRKQVTIKVDNSLLNVNIKEDTIFIDLGNVVDITADFENVDNDINFLWYTFANPKPECPTCQNVRVQPLNDGYFLISMTNAAGCIVRDSVFIRVKKDRAVYFPNIISGNGDGINDKFFLSGNETGSDGLFMRVYDRWGNLVFDGGAFELNDEAYGWDGSVNGQLAVNGVYTWYAGIRYIDGFEQTVKGDVTVIR